LAIAIILIIFALKFCNSPIVKGMLNSNKKVSGMKVLKFGGTSVGSVSSILSLQKIVEKEAKCQPVIVVVSALSGITDQLIATSQLALKGDEGWRLEFDTMVERHHKMIDAIITDEPELVKEEKNILENNYTYYDKILRLINLR